MVCRQGSGADPSSQIVLHTTHIVSIMTQIVIVSLSHRAAACRETQIVPLMTQIVQSGVERANPSDIRHQKVHPASKPFMGRAMGLLGRVGAASCSSSEGAPQIVADRGSRRHLRPTRQHRTPLLDAVRERGLRDAEVPFHVPGHCRGRGAHAALSEVGRVHAIDSLRIPQSVR